MRSHAVIVLLAGLMVAACVRYNSVAHDNPAAVTTIRAEDIGRSVQVVGRLGPPLRQVMSVEGTWMEIEFTQPQPKPDTRLRFRVETVNGKRLDKPVDLRSLDLNVIDKDGKEVELVVGEKWVMRAYETWPDYGHPHDYAEDLSKSIASPPPRGPTRLIGILKQRTAK